jgi:hypothetical protein
MILFHIKKGFFDAWDNMIGVLLANALLAILYGAEAFLFWVIFSNRGAVPVSLVELGFLLAGCELIAVASGAVAHYVNKMADFGKAGIRDLWAGLKLTAARSALFGVTVFAAVLVLVIGIRFYFGRGDFLSSLAAGLLLWVGFFLTAAFQYFFAVMVRLEGRFFRLLRKCFMIALDNVGFSLYLIIWHGLGVILSVFTAGFIPGAAGILLSSCEAIRLRVYKYDWLEAHPGAKRSEIPWDELIKDDEELVGPRSLRGMIFPWKDSRR